MSELARDVNSRSFLQAMRVGGYTNRVYGGLSSGERIKIGYGKFRYAPTEQESFDPPKINVLVEEIPGTCFTHKTLNHSIYWDLCWENCVECKKARQQFLRSVPDLSDRSEDRIERLKQRIADQIRERIERL